MEKHSSLLLCKSLVTRAARSLREAEHLQRPVKVAMRPLLGGLRLHSLRGMHHRSTRLEEKRENGSTEDDLSSL